MYPRGELNRLAARKALLQARIAVRRLECLQHAHGLARPVRLLDRAWALWRTIAPMAKLVGVPALLWAGGRFVRRGRGGGGGGFAGKLGSLLKYAPLVMKAARAFSQARAGAQAHAHASGAGR